MAKFGKLIHKYTIKDGVDDGAIVPLIYEGRFVEQNVDEANIDLWFKQTTKRLTEAQRDDLSRKWSSIRRLTSTDARIKRIALDINEHSLMGTKIPALRLCWPLTTSGMRFGIWSVLTIWGFELCRGDLTA